MENFSLKCSKIVKKASYLEKSARTVTHECQKVNSGGYLTFYCPVRARVKCYLLVWQIQTIVIVLVMVIVIVLVVLIFSNSNSNGSSKSYWKIKVAIVYDRIIAVVIKRKYYLQTSSYVVGTMLVATACRNLITMVTHGLNKSWSKVKVQN